MKQLRVPPMTTMFASHPQDVPTPGLTPGDAVIRDDLTSHQSEEAAEAIGVAGARLVRLPPWGPDLTPIEEMVSKVKTAMRSLAARTTETVYAAFASALHEVSLEDIAGWFGHRAAYAMQT
jgi:transposase